MRATPIFFLASAFNSRTSDAVQARLTVFFLAIFGSSFFLGAGLLSHQEDLAMRCRLFGGFLGQSPAS
jgi:hypothetical protein